MKKPNTLPELLRHAADLAEKGELLAGKFEYMCDEGWITCMSNTPNLFSGYPWRIADQDQHLLDDGWIRHTGDGCPVHPKTKVEVMLMDNQLMFKGDANDFYWRKDLPLRIIQYKVIKESRTKLHEPTKDEIRYAYLRSRPLDAINKGGVFAGLTPENIVLNGEDLDAYIDEAIKESK